VAPQFDLAIPTHSRLNVHTPTTDRILHPEHFIWETTAKLAM